MSKYLELDKAITKAIASGSGIGTMTGLDSLHSGLRALIEPHRTEDRYGLTPTFRIIDRRLQALRKAGVIHYANKTWMIKP